MASLISTRTTSAKRRCNTPSSTDFHQIAGFQVLNVGVGIAGDMKGMRLNNFHAGEQRGQVGR